MIKKIIDLKEKENMRLYYASKERFGEKLSNRDKFISDIAEKVKLLISPYNLIIIPESSNDFIESIVQKLEKKYLIIKKNKKEYILKNTYDMNLQKKERASHLEKISNMDGSFKVNKLKANQRKKYINCLFEKIDLSNFKAVIIDDSIFSGTTYESLKYSTGVSDAIFIFGK